MSKKCLLSLLLFSAQLAGHAIFSASSKADSEKDLEELIGLVKQTGTKVLTSSNCEARISGFYLPPNKEGTGDRLVFCTNNIDLKDTSALWEVLAHEVAHVMQACAGGPIWKDIYHPRLLRGLKGQAPHYAEILNQYKGEDKLLELEAFDMELKTAREVKELFVNLCMQQKSHESNTGEPPALPNSIFEVVGGRNSFMELMAWASKNLRSNQLAMLNDVLASGNISEIKRSLLELQSMYNDSRTYQNYRLF
jgi:hypothetical protein